MVDVSQLTSADIGRWVRFYDYDSKKLGRIKSWNEYNIFVVYLCDGDWENYADYTAEATHGSRLEFTEEGN